MKIMIKSEVECIARDRRSNNGGKRLHTSDKWCSSGVPLHLFDKALKRQCKTVHL